MSTSVPLPPFPSPKGDLEEFLLSPHNLPIHDFSRQQKSVSFILVEDKIMYFSIIINILYSLVMCPQVMAP